MLTSHRRLHKISASVSVFDKQPAKRRYPMKILITAPENENHTAPLKWALEQAGYSVACWAGLGWTEAKQASISLLPDLQIKDPHIKDTQIRATQIKDTQLKLGHHLVDPGDVIWIRRPVEPKPNPQTAPEDAKFAANEYRSFYDSLMYLLETLPVRIVNKHTASRFINNKSVQLMLARACGMNVPRTLMANSPQAIREFFHANPQRMICKTFSTHIWEKEQGGPIVVTETFELSPDMLPSDEVLTYAPAIYQEMVVKKFDVRMVLLGAAVYSYSLHNPKGALDWRHDATQNLLKVELIITPPEVEKSVLAFAAKSGIACGSFDFAIDNQDRWWFLEVNEGGQFLWLDAANPNLHVQEKFLAFLTAPAASSRQMLEARQSEFPSWSDYLASPAKDLQLPEEADPDASSVSVEA
jgi:glutathione synthase/RimK-type ligase-like ATP-grasp enzyme